MRLLLAASALALIMSATPSMARDYPWCARTSSSGFEPSCSFTSFRQCMATVSGQGGDCMRNPLIAYSQSRQYEPYREPRQRRVRRAAPDRGWDNDDWNGWNRSW